MMMETIEISSHKDHLDTMMNHFTIIGIIPSSIYIDVMTKPADKYTNNTSHDSNTEVHFDIFISCVQR